MKIGLVIHPYGEKNPSGLGKAMFEKSKAIIEGSPKDEFVLFVKNEPKEKPDVRGENWRIEVLNNTFFFKPGLLCGYENEIDVWVFFSPIMPIFFKPKRAIVIAWDFAFKFFTAKNLQGKIKSFLMSFLYQRAFEKASVICTVSHTTKKELLRFFNVPETKVKAIHHGYIQVCGEEEGAEVEGLPDKFFLFLGVIKERKNVLRIIEAYHKVSAQLEGVKLVIAGKSKGEYFNKVVQYVKDNSLEEDVLFLGYVDNNQLPTLYKRAIAVVFPSILEGFGMPVLEAMDCGTAVLTSNTGSLAEVAADAALCVDPLDVGAISDGMLRLSKDETYRNELIVKGSERIREFSWHSAALEYISIIHSFDEKYEE